MAESNISMADVQAVLSGLEFPVKKQDVVDYATQHGASEDIISILDQLPDHDYNGPRDVGKELEHIMQE